MLKNDVRKAAEEIYNCNYVGGIAGNSLDTGPQTLSHTLNTGIFWVFLKNHKKIQILFNLLNNSI